MAKKESNPNQDNDHKLYLEYFPGITQTSMINVKPLAINVEELQELLQTYGIENHYSIFSKLASLALSYQNHWKHSIKLMNEFDELDNQEIDLLCLAWNLILKKVSWIEIICSSGEKVKLTYPSSIHEFGEAINQKFSNLTNQTELASLKKNIKKKGRLPSKMHLQILIFRILKYLNNETNLKSGDTLISNKQANFIFDFLQFSKVIKPDSTSILDQEYIRTSLNNFLTRYPDFDNSNYINYLK